MFARFSIFGSAVALICAFSGSSSAGIIIYTNTTTNDKGTGFGNIDNLLSVSQTANGTTEFGAVAWNGTTRVLTGEATNQSEVQTAATVAGITGFNAASGFFEFGLIFNINEPGNATNVTLNDFTLRFYDAGGGTLFDLTYSAPAGGLTLTDQAQGQGGAGSLFFVRLDNAEASSFFANPNNRLGQFITPGQAISQVAGGAENFYIQRSNNGNDANGNPAPPIPTPEPATLAVFGALAGFGALGYRLRRKTPVAN